MMNSERSPSQGEVLPACHQIWYRIVFIIFSYDIFEMTGICMSCLRPCMLTTTLWSGVLPVCAGLRSNWGSWESAITQTTKSPSSWMELAWFLHLTQFQAFLYSLLFTVAWIIISNLKLTLLHCVFLDCVDGWSMMECIAQKAKCMHFWAASLAAPCSPDSLFCLDVSHAFWQYLLFSQHILKYPFIFILLLAPHKISYYEEKSISFEYRQWQQLIVSHVH